MTDRKLGEINKIFFDAAREEYQVDADEKQRRNDREESDLAEKNRLYSKKEKEMFKSLSIEQFGYELEPNKGNEFHFKGVRIWVKYRGEKSDKTFCDEGWSFSISEPNSGYSGVNSILGVAMALARAEKLEKQKAENKANRAEKEKRDEIRSAEYKNQQQADEKIRNEERNNAPPPAYAFLDEQGLNSERRPFDVVEAISTDYGPQALVRYIVETTG